MCGWLDNPIGQCTVGLIEIHQAPIWDKPITLIEHTHTHRNATTNFSEVSSSCSNHRRKMQEIIQRKVPENHIWRGCRGGELESTNRRQVSNPSHPPLFLLFLTASEFFGNSFSRLSIRGRVVMQRTSTAISRQKRHFVCFWMRNEDFLKTGLSLSR